MGCVCQGGAEAIRGQDHRDREGEGRQDTRGDRPRFRLSSLPVTPVVQLAWYTTLARYEDFGRVSRELIIANVEVDSARWAGKHKKREGIAQLLSGSLIVEGKHRSGEGGERRMRVLQVYSVYLAPA